MASGPDSREWDFSFTLGTSTALGLTSIRFYVGQGILEIRPSLGLLLFRQSSAYRGDLQDTRGSIPPESQCHCCRHTLWVGQYAHRATTNTTYIEAKKKL